jgi:hypothetical protein
MAELLWSQGKTPPQISAVIGEPPDVRQIQRWIEEFEGGAPEEAGPWVMGSLADPEDDRAVLAEVGWNLSNEASPTLPSIEHARWIARLSRVVSNPPAGLIYRAARWYTARRRAGRSTQDWDVGLAMRAWADRATYHRWERVLQGMGAEKTLAASLLFHDYLPGTKRFKRGTGSADTWDDIKGWSPPEEDEANS